MENSALFLDDEASRTADIIGAFSQETSSSRRTPILQKKYKPRMKTKKKSMWSSLFGKSSNSARDLFASPKTPVSLRPSTQITPTMKALCISGSSSLPFMSPKSKAKDLSKIDVIDLSASPLVRSESCSSDFLSLKRKTRMPLRASSSVYIPTSSGFSQPSGSFTIERRKTFDDLIFDVDHPDVCSPSSKRLCFSQDFRLSIFKDTCTSTPTREQLVDRASKNCDLDLQLDCFRKQGLRLLCIDFDDTFLNIHTNNSWRGSAIELMGHIRPVFKAYLEYLLKEDFLVAIVTFSQQLDLVQRVLNLCCPHGLIEKNLFICGGREGNPRIEKLEVLPKCRKSAGIVDLCQDEVKENRKPRHSFPCSTTEIKAFYQRRIDVCSASHIKRIKGKALEQGLLSTGKCCHIALVVDYIQRKLNTRISHKEVLYIDDDKNNIELAAELQPNIKAIWFKSILGDLSAERTVLKDLASL